MAVPSAPESELLLRRAFSASSRCSLADGFDSRPSAKTFAAEPNSCFFQP